MKKRLLAMFLGIVMAVSLAILPTQAAYEPQYTDEAETLYELGLFKGTGTNPDGTPVFSLQNNATRLQALIMLIRLLGQEDEALATTAANPFTDIDSNSSGAKYAAYAYETGITKGIGGGKFGNTSATPAQFLTFVLCALGYDDSQGDFSVGTALQKALEVGLITEELQLSGNTLKRDACAKISYSALGTNLKDTDKTLAEKLVADGTLTEKAVEKSGVLHKLTYIPFSGENRVRHADFAALVSGPIGGVGFYGMMTDNAIEKFQQSDWSPEALALCVHSVGEYICGRENSLKTSRDWKPKANAEWVFYASPAHYDWLLITDQDTHLIGYALVPPLGHKDGRLPFVSCHVDMTEEIEQMREACATQYKNAVEFKTDALRTETVTTFVVNNAGQKFERSTQSLFIDSEKLPESLRDYKYFALFDQREGSKENKVREAWVEVQTDFLMDSADFSPMQTSGQEVSGRFLGEDPNDVLMLFDENRTMLGYCLINEKLPDTETIVTE